MNKDHIIQFVGFATQLSLEEFSSSWETFAKTFTTVPGDMILQQETGLKGKYKYVSQHECRKQDFSFKFMKGRTSEHFPDKKVKVVQTGGYTVVEIGCHHHDENTDVKIIAFIGHDETDINFYRSLSYRYINIYQAYYENCAYGYILEFFIAETDAAEFILQLKKRTGIEVAAYRECMTPHE
jgi:hypothetical protein